jgi:predicted ATP-dependent protease
LGQHGELQLIGGVNEKIEGFWEICRARRARGERPEGPYGVLIPLANADDLMLRPAVVASIVEEGWFHVWPIPDVDAGLPLLTGLPAATIHARVDRQLREFYELARRPEVLA